MISENNIARWMLDEDSKLDVQAKLRQYISRQSTVAYSELVEKLHKAIENINMNCRNDRICGCPTIIKLEIFHFVINPYFWN